MVLKFLREFHRAGSFYVIFNISHWICSAPYFVAHYYLWVLKILCGHKNRLKMVFVFWNTDKDTQKSWKQKNLEEIGKWSDVKQKEPWKATFSISKRNEWIENVLSTFKNCIETILLIVSIKIYVLKLVLKCSIHFNTWNSS